MKRYVWCTLSILLSTNVALAEELPVSPTEKPTSLVQVGDAERKPARDGGRVRLGVRPWLSKGESEFEIGFLLLRPDSSIADVGSLLEWEGLDSEVLFIHGEVDFTDWLTMGVGFGRGDIDDGRSVDTDTFDGLVGTQSEADADGEVEMAEASFYVDLFKLIKQRPRALDVDVFVGRQKYREELRDRNGVFTVSGGRPVNMPFADLDSTFEFDWEAFRLGARAEYPLARNLTVRGQGAALLGVDYESEGFWNLRSDFRQTSPNFEQEADGGTGFDLRLALVLQIAEHVAIEAGYWTVSLEVKNGEDRVFLADGTTETTQMDHATSQRHGFYAGIMGSF